MSQCVNSIYFVWTFCIKLSVTSQEFKVSSINRAKIPTKKTPKHLTYKKNKEFFISRVFFVLGGGGILALFMEETLNSCGNIHSIKPP